MFYWIMEQLLVADVLETDVQRIRCRSSNAFSSRIVVFLWAILLSEMKLENVNEIGFSIKMTGLSFTDFEN